MLKKRHVLLALGVTGVAAVALMKAIARRMQRSEVRVDKKEALQRWEAEGGNILTPSAAVQLDRANPPAQDERP